jgi:hypothetical protein
MKMTFILMSSSRRMEETFLLLKSERDELIKRQSTNRDSTDGKTTTTVTEEIANLKTELKRQKTHYEAQFIEYVRISLECTHFDDDDDVDG